MIVVLQSKLTIESRFETEQDEIVCFNIEFVYKNPFYMQQFTFKLSLADKPQYGFGHVFRMAIVFIAVFLASARLQAQTSNGRFLTFDFSTLTATPANAIPTTANAAIDTTGLRLTRGSGLSAQNFAGFYAYRNFDESSENNAISANDFLQIPINLNTGWEARLD